MFLPLHKLGTHYRQKILGRSIKGIVIIMALQSGFVFSLFTVNICLGFNCTLSQDLALNMWQYQLNLIFLWSYQCTELIVTFLCMISFLLELQKVVCMLCVMGRCFLIVQYHIFNLQIFNKKTSVELELLCIPKRKC